MTDRQIHELLEKMSTEEKIGQMVQFTGSLYSGNPEEVLTGPENTMNLTAEDLQMCGTILGTVGAGTLAEIQKKYMEKHPHRIPMMFMLDVIHGLKTIFPIPLAMAGTFDPDLADRCCEMAAKESAVSGVHVCFAPMADLVRDARWGRVMESFGEDPYLASEMTAAMVRGFQGSERQEDGSLGKDRIAACVKHFAAYGAALAGRDYNEAEVDDYTLHNQYLKAYQAGIDAGAMLVMSAFNTVNGVPASGSKPLLRDMLREEMGFDGVVISDYSALRELQVHGTASDEKEAAAAALKAGVDIDMVSPVYIRALKQLAEEDSVCLERIDEAVWRILKLKNRLGLFENPFRGANSEREKEVILCREHRDLARQAAAESFVLLKNSGILPIEKKPEEDAGFKIAMIGPYIESREVISSWAIMGAPGDCVTIREGIEEAWGRTENVRYCQGSPMLGEKDHDAMDAATMDPDARMKRYDGVVRAVPEEIRRMREEAVSAAKEADLIVMALGETRYQTGEASSRGFLDLPQVQMELYRAVRRVNENVVVVLFGGRPLDLREISESAAAVLQVWFPGTESGHAVADVLTGKISPSGKLAVSFPYSVGQVPVFYNYMNTGRPNSAMRANQYYSRYLDMPNEPLYPFGYGLSYTAFEMHSVQADREWIQEGETLHLALELENTGSRTGAEVVQVYLRDVCAKGTRPVRELIDFKRVCLKPGEKRHITFDINDQKLAYYRPDGTYGCDPGLFVLYVGTSSTAENKVEFCRK